MAWRCIVIALVLAGAAPAQDLKVVFVDVGQGQGAFLVGPTGTVMIVDGGPEGEGDGSMRTALLGNGIVDADIAVASHYHSDHIGGLDELWNKGYRPNVCYDRGTGNVPSTSAYNNYKNKYASVRQEITPGQVIDLGGGATATCLVVNGDLMGGSSVGVGGGDIENPSSIALLISYGDFQLYLPGDLTGGGLGTPDVESSTAAVAGNVDVMMLAHHGSNSSSQGSVIATLDPELGIVCAGTGNPFGHPHTEPLDEFTSASNVRALWATTSGTGKLGPVVSGGAVEIVTDGLTYSVYRQGGAPVTFITDENTANAPALTGDLVVGEFMAMPTMVGDPEGEYIEIASSADGPVHLTNLRITSDAGVQVTVHGGYRLDPLESIVLAQNGDPGANGGFDATAVMRLGAFPLPASNGSIRLHAAFGFHDLVRYETAWGVAPGIGHQRRHLLGDPIAVNFGPSSTTLAMGDKGTPGQINDNDVTSSVTSLTLVGQAAPGEQLDWLGVAPGSPVDFFWFGVSAGWIPGIDLFGSHIWLNLDTVMLLFLQAPGFFGVTSATGTATAGLPIPDDPTLSGILLYTSFVTLDPFPLAVSGLTPPYPVVIQ